MLNFILGIIFTYFLINIYIAISNFNVMNTEYKEILTVAKMKLLLDVVFGCLLANSCYKIATKLMSMSTVERILKEVKDAK